MSELTRPQGGRMVLQMLGGAGITVAVLLPLYLIDRQATSLAIAKLEMELAHSGAPAAAAAPASPPAPAAAPEAARPAPVAPVVVVPSPPPSRDTELAQMTRALSDLAQRVERVAPPAAPERTAEARAASVDAPRSLASGERSVRVTDLRVRVYYESRCLGLVNDVMERLLQLHVNPESIETRQVRTGVSRLVYMGDDQAAAAAAIADGLSSLIPVDVEPDMSGAAAGGPRLELAGAPACQRPR